MSLYAPFVFLRFRRVSQWEKWSSCFRIFTSNILEYLLPSPVGQGSESPVTSVRLGLGLKHKQSAIVDVLVVFVACHDGALLEPTARGDKQTRSSVAKKTKTTSKDTQPLSGPDLNGAL